MVTPRSLFGIARTRPSASPLRMLWLALLLFGFVYTHGLSANSAAGHVAPRANAPSAVASSVDDAHGPAGGAVAVVAPRGGDADGHGSSHPATECVPGQPQSAPGPVASGLMARAWGPAAVPILAAGGTDRFVPAAPASVTARGPGVLQV
ncbi:hypothetical protein OIE62_06235 [Streptomyces scopuliridis]|uniref:Uncharacterized protein n=1 Tax=Streptomyces scopuliridis TaxID=452529 RepID=A0ACD4ZUW7_9ACTN|nr:hypothetical protein [Streptomyces scopuliridis]WSC01817.1 hypothetical protein OG835_35590 [Streptomyces scopuliridis]WSC04646.1 hypothetical protein OIE62_06235 [Streptomyces scopuliridis]